MILDEIPTTSQTRNTWTSVAHPDESGDDETSADDVPPSSDLKFDEVSSPAMSFPMPGEVDEMEFLSDNESECC